MKRICIFTQDIQLITGKSDRNCRKILSDIKKSLNKEKHQLVTIEEICNYLGIEKSSVMDLIK